MSRAELISVLRDTAASVSNTAQADIILSDCLLRLQMLERLESMERHPAPLGDEDLLTSEQVEQRLGCGHNHLNRVKKAGWIKWTRIGKGDKFHPRDVDQLIADLAHPVKSKQIAQDVHRLRMAEQARQKARAAV